MEAVFGTYYANDDLGDRRLPDNTEYLRTNAIFRQGSAEAVALGARFRQQLDAGETLYLVGFLGTTHNSGLSLIKASAREGIVVVANLEEERFSEIKHFAGYPKLAVAELRRLLASLGVSTERIFGIFYAFDVVEEEQSGMRMLLVNSKTIRNKFYKFITESAAPSVDFNAADLAQMRSNIFAHSPATVSVVRSLRTELDLPQDAPCVAMLHHENHAAFAFGASPFAGGQYTDQQTVIACVDGGGDKSSVSLFEAKDGQLKLIKRNFRANSLGVFYMLCSSLLGGWSALSSEGRYMGAAAWGNTDRLTNRYYKRLRQVFYFGPDGQVFLNAAMTEDAYRELQAVVGNFLPLDSIWSPDAILNVDDIQHSPVTRDRVDIAAAVQMVFEDALFHIIGDLIESTGAEQLVLCGGTALNCVANMRLLNHFGRQYYRDTFGRDGFLKLWVPPIPSDQGVVVGAAYQFALLNGARPQGALPTPFLCGLAPGRDDLEAALLDASHVKWLALGSVHSDTDRPSVADFMAHVVSHDGILGIYQGAAETGPRALGHRSILSNPCNPKILEVLNSRVKMRERIRPLAPMVTMEEAAIWFELAEGAAAAEFDAYDYMVLTANARPAARAMIPAVIHYDGTSRIQIVRRRNNPLIHDYLRALKPRIGVEVSVNTSLNVGSPIVQTPQQALQVFQRSKGLDGIVMIAADGEAYAVWAKPAVQSVESRLPSLMASFEGLSHSRRTSVAAAE